MFARIRTILSLALLVSACGGKAAAPPTAASSPSPTVAPPLSFDDSSATAHESPAQVLSLASPVSGPAQDELPPAPPRPVERNLLDLTQLTEAPVLEIDALGHQSKVRALTFTHDGRHLVSAGYDKTIRVWSSATGELTRTLRGEIGGGPGGRIYATALSEGDALLAVGGWLGKFGDRSYVTSRSDAYKIRILDFYSGNTLRLLEGHYDVVLSLAFAHYGRRLVSGGGDRQARIWDADTGRMERSLSGHSEGVAAVAFSPDDRLIATASLDKTARLWETATGRLVATLTGHGGAVQAIGFTPDGKYLLTGSLDRTLRLWDGKTGEFIKILAHQEAGIAALSIAPDGTRVVTGCADGNFENRVVAIPDGQQLARFNGHDNIVLATAVSPNGRWAATAGGSDYAIAVWDLKNGKQQIHMAGHGATIWSVGFSSDGSAVAWGNRFDQKGYSEYQFNGPLQHAFRLGNAGDAMGPGPDLGNDTGFVRAQTRIGNLELRTPTGREHATLEVRDSGRTIATITRDVTSGFDHRSFTFSPDGRSVISGGANGTLTAFDAQNGTKLRDFVGHTGDVLAVAVSPNGNLVVSGSADQTVKVWEMRTGGLLLTLFQARNGQWVAFTPAGYYASSTYGDGYLGWHVNRGADQSAGYYAASALSPDFRSEVVVTRYLQDGGDIERAIAQANQGLYDWQTKITYRRFEELPQFAPPTVYFMEPGLDTSVASDRQLFRAKAYAATAEPITEMYFLVNGRKVDERWWQAVGRPRVNYSGRYAEIIATLPLPQTINRISVVARNRFNLGAPESIEVRRKGGPRELEQIYRPDLYVLSIGISSYNDPTLQPLRYAHLDAGAIADALQKQSGKLYGRIYARTLIDQRASASALREGLRWLSQNATQKDMAIIFIAGHAVLDERDNYYFIPYGGSLNQLEQNALRWTEFQSVLDALPSKVVLLADTCHGGSITGKGERSRGAARPRDMSNALRANLSAGTGVVVMTASTGVEESFESDRWKHGAFTKALLEGLAGNADYDKDRSVYIRELDHFLSKRVTQLTEGRQHPTTEVPRSMPNFPFVAR